MTGLLISAVGLTSSLGLDSELSCAAARAGLVRTSPIDTLNTANEPLLAKETLDGIPPVVVHAAPFVGKGCAGLGKLVALGRPALQNVVDKGGLGRQALARTGLCLCLSDDFHLRRWGAPAEPIGQQPAPDRKATRQAIHERLGDSLWAAASLPSGPARQWWSSSGRIGLLSAMAKAAEWLKSSDVDQCLIGTIDSLIEPDVLEACGSDLAIKTDAQPVGFIPGEAAALLLVRAARDGANTAGMLRIRTVAMAIDAGYSDPDKQPIGRGISSAVSAALARYGTIARMPPVVLADINGLECRSSDWGHALIHLRGSLGPFESDLWLPVDSFGETGAATGGIALCMAFEAARRSQLDGDCAMIVLCADDGGRAAVVVEASHTRH